MAHNVTTHSARHTAGLIVAMICLAMAFTVSSAPAAFARAVGGGGGYAGGRYSGGYGHAGWGGRGGFVRGGHLYHYGYGGVLVEDCCYAAPFYGAPMYGAPVYIAPPVPVFVSPFGIFVR